MVWADDREWDAAKFVSGRRGTLRRTVIQLYSGMLRNSRSMASWGVWEGRLTRNGGGLYLEILSVLWLSDRTVRCVRWLYIQVIFKDSFTEPAARSCQAEEKCQSGFFFCCFLALSENLCAQHLEWKRAILSVLENTVRYIYDFLNCWEFRLAYSGKHQ